MLNPNYINDCMVNALNRGNILLFRSIKICNINSHLSFLRECKRRCLLPRGFLVKNKLSNTYPCLEAQSLQIRQGKQWMTLCIAQLFRKLRYWQYHPCGPLNHGDSMVMSNIIASLKVRKHRKLQVLISNFNSSKHSNDRVPSSPNPTNSGDIHTTVTAFSNLSSKTFSKKELDILNLGPAYVPPLNNNDLKKADSVINASMNSLRRQISFHESSTKNESNVASSSSSLNNTDTNSTTYSFPSWRFTFPHQRTYGDMPFLSHSNEQIISQLENDIHKTCNKAISHQLNNSYRKQINKVIFDLRNTDDIVIMPTDKTQRLIALNTDTYDNLYAAHLTNYLPLNKQILPSSLQQSFNRKLNTIVKEIQPNIASWLNHGKCSEPVPCQMTIIPKDHKQPLSGRPLVAATDSPGTKLSKILADLMKPLLDKVSSHLSSTSNLILKYPMFILIILHLAR